MLSNNTPLVRFLSALDSQHPGRHGQGAIHPFGRLWDFPAQLPVGPRPSTRPGEPRVAGPGLAGRGGTRRRAPDH